MCSWSRVPPAGSFGGLWWDSQARPTLPYFYFEVNSKSIGLSPDLTSRSSVVCWLYFTGTVSDLGVARLFGNLHAVLAQRSAGSSRTYFRTYSPLSSVKPLASWPPTSMGVKMTPAWTSGFPSSVTRPWTCPKPGRPWLPQPLAKSANIAVNVAMAQVGGPIKRPRRQPDTRTEQKCWA